MITRREIALVHVYAKLAALPDTERRQLMLRVAGVYSSRQLDQAGFEAVMAELESVLWTRVDAGLVHDPRTCTRCRAPLRRLKGGHGACPEACERRKVYAWDPRYWRRKLPADGAANSRQQRKIRQLWTLLQDYLPPDERNDAYLAGLIRKASRDSSAALDALTAAQAHRVIEALKDRLSYSVK